MPSVKKIIEIIKKDAVDILKAIREEDGLAPARDLASVLGVDEVFKKDGRIHVRSKRMPLDEYIGTLEEKRIREAIKSFMEVDENFKYQTPAGVKRSTDRLIKDGEATTWLKRKINEYSEKQPELVPAILNGLNFISGVGSDVAVQNTLERYLGDNAIRLPAIAENVSMLRSRIIDPEVKYDPKFNIGQGWEARTTAIALGIILNDRDVLIGNDPKERDWAIYKVTSYILDRLDELERRAISKGLDVANLVNEVLPGRNRIPTMDELRERVGKVDLEDAMKIINVFEATIRRVETIGHYTSSRSA